MSTPSHPQPPSNPAHKRQVIWQVWLPLVFFFLVFLGLCVLAVTFTFNGNPVAENWAALSVIIVILPSCLGGLFAFLFLGLGIFLTAKATHGLPGLTYKLQVFFKKASVIIRHFADRLASPVININGKWAGFSSIFRSRAKK